GQEFASAQAQSSSSKAEVQLRQSIEERAALDANLNARLAELRGISEELRARRAEVEKWRVLEKQTALQLQQQTSAIAVLETEYSSAAADRVAANRKLEESENALLAVQKKYDALREERSAVLLRTASLEQRIEELRSRLREIEAADQ